MIRVRRYFIIKTVYILIDLFFLYFCMYGACWLRKSILSFKVNFDNLLFDPVNPYRFVSWIWILSTIFFNNAHGLYQTRREIYESLEIWEIIKSIILSLALTMGVIYFAKIQDFPRSILVMMVTFTTASFSSWRILKRFFVLYLVSQGYNNFNALIVGAGKVGVALAQEIEKKPSLGIKVVGFLDDFKMNDPKYTGPKISGKISDFVEVARKEFVNKVFITLHHDSRVFLDLLEQARDLGVAVRVVPQGFDLMPSEFCKYNIGFIPILEYCEAENFRKQAGKRLFDFVIAFILSIILLPIYSLLAILIKLDSPGPVFYLSRRYGRRGRIFKMYKFRSMVYNADKIKEQLKDKNEVDGPIFKIKNDPRVTTMGRFLRRYSLDELPQIINVMKGDMSLVGPRPLPIDQVEKEDLRQLKRLEVRPGITGLWQVRGRSDISFSRLVKWDVWYINNWSFWLDFNILLQTLPVVIKGKGAY